LISLEREKLETVENQVKKLKADKTEHTGRDS